MKKKQTEERVTNILEEDQDYLFEIKFRYVKGSDTLPETVVCQFFIGEYFLNGYAYCHPDDPFVKETGRKLALTKAMELLEGKVEFLRKVRAQIWDAYHERRFEGRVQA